MPGNDEPDWKRLALHALHDLRLLGVDITQMDKMTFDVVKQVNAHTREMEAYS